MVVARTHETTLAPEFMFNAIRDRLPQYNAFMPDSKTMGFRFTDSNTYIQIDITVDVFEKVNRVNIWAISYSKGMFNSSTLGSVEHEMADYVMSILVSLEREVENQKLMDDQRKMSESQQNLLNSVKAMVPSHMESGTQSALLFEINNNTFNTITDFQISFPDIEDYFTITGELKLTKILPGMDIEHSFLIKPKFQKGKFPLNIIISGNGVTVEQSYFIKVGGTEIY